MFEPYIDKNGDTKYKLATPANELIEGINRFFEDYFIDTVAIHTDKKPSLKPKAERICRFCNKSMPEVTFNKDAHTLPQFLKNRHLVSDFECDLCNQLFSKYETQWTYFLGLSRTLSYLKGQEGIPKFKTPDKKLVIGMDSEEGRLKIISEGMENVHWEIDEDNKKMSIHAVKQPYIPIQVFKALLKIGLCYIPEEDVPNFEKAFIFLKNALNDDKPKGDPIFRLYIHVLAGAAIPFPVIFRMKRKPTAKNYNCPTWCFIIYAGNYVFQFFLPLHEKDRKLIMKEQKVSLPLCPPFMSQQYVALHGLPSKGNFDLSSSEKVENEKQVVTMSFDSIHYPKSSQE